MKSIFLLIIFSILITNNCFSQDFQWVRQIKGIIDDYNDFTTGLAVDNDENCYTIGNTESRLFDLDPTLTGTNIIDNTLINHTFRGTFLIKTDIDGNYIWGLTFGNYKGSDQAYDVKIGTDGNIYALLSIGELNTTLNVIDTFIKIIKISPSGNIISTISIKQNFDNSGNMNVNSFDLDNQNNIYLGGWFVGNILINNNPNFHLNNNNGMGNYLLKINNNGNFDWLKQFNISNNTGNKVILRPDGNINLLINNSNGYNLYNIDSSNNSIIWQDDFVNQTQVTYHVSNNSIVILGNKDYSQTVDVDPSLNINNVSGICVFIIFLNLDGSFLDVKQFEKPTNGSVDFGTVTTDVFGNYYFGGNFGDTVDFDPSANIFNLSSNGSYGEAFYLKFDSNRNFQNAFNIGHENPNISQYHNCSGLRIIKINIKNNNNYLIGNFAWWCDFDPSITSQYTLGTLNGVTLNSDGFILKLGPCDSLLPIASDNQSFCSSQNPTVSNLYPNSNSYRWYSSLTSTIQLLQTTPLVNGQTYYVSKQIGNCPESARLPVTVTINQSPLTPISTNQIFCEDEYATISDLNVTGQNVKWYLSLTDTISLPINTILQNNTNYYCSQTINGCESDRTLINVTVNSVPLPTLTSPQNFCIQQNATLNSITITGQNIKWYDAQTGGNLLLSSTNLVDATTYYASQTINGCESLRVPVLINIQNTPTPTGNINQSFCSTQNASLNDITVSGSNVLWYNSATSTTPLPLSTVLANGVTYYATQTINNCESINRLAVTINLINTLNATNYSETLCDDLNDGTENVSLANYNANLISNTTGCTFEYYSTLNGAINQIRGDQINSNYNLNLGLNTIYVRITSINTCFQLVQLNLTLVSKPIIPIADIVPMCDNSSVTINAGTNANTYLWSNGATTPTITVSQTGNYSVTATHNYGLINCSTIKNFVVVLSNAATISQIETVDFTENQNTITVYLDASSIGDYEYSIDGIHYQESNVFTNLYSGIYYVYVKDKNNCGQVIKEVFLLNYPKFFTPNGDGYNDTWSINFSFYEKGIITEIYDRFGKLLKVLNHRESWDGKQNGNMLPADDYWFVVNRTNGKVYKGHFAMKR